MQNDFGACFRRWVTDLQIAENRARKVYIVHSRRRHFLGFGVIATALVVAGCSNNDAPVPSMGSPATKGNRSRLETKAQKAESLPSAKK
jgi:hypothetical protein